MSKCTVHHIHATVQFDVSRIFFQTFLKMSNMLINKLIIQLKHYS